jgi:hypothetical protein
VLLALRLGAVRSKGEGCAAQALPRRHPARGPAGLAKQDCDRLETEAVAAVILGDRERGQPGGLPGRPLPVIVGGAAEHLGDDRPHRTDLIRFHRQNCNVF